MTLQGHVTVTCFMVLTYPLSALRGSFSWLYAKHPHATDAVPIRFPHARQMVIFSSRSTFQSRFHNVISKDIHVLQVICFVIKFKSIRKKPTAHPILKDKKICQFLMHLRSSVPFVKPPSRLWRKSRSFDCSNAC